MIHVKYTKRELAAILKCSVQAARTGAITTSSMQNIVMGVYDALGGRYERLWNEIANYAGALHLAPSGRPFQGDQPGR